MKIRRRTFKKFGQVWKWYSNYRKNGWREHWESTNGNAVEIFPPEKYTTYWWVFVYPSKDSQGTRHGFSGRDAGERAFIVAEVFTRQQSL